MQIRKFFVNGEWKHYSEWTTSENEKCNWEDVILLAESKSKLPLKIGGVVQWANSGIEIFAYSEDEVINYLNDKAVCIMDAVSELVEEIIVGAEVDNDNSKIETMIDTLYEMI